VCGALIPGDARGTRSPPESEAEERHEFRGPPITVTVDGRPVALPRAGATGAHIKRAARANGASIQQDYLLVQINAGQPDRVVADDTVVEFTEGSRFLSMAMAAYMGAEGRYEDWIYLEMLQREWDRPVRDCDPLPGVPPGTPSPRSAIVILFWSYFETRINRLLRTAMRNLPEGLREHTLQRYSAIGARMEKLYHILFRSTYLGDLNRLGYEDVAIHLQEVWWRRNEFSHGQPAAIGDELVAAVVRNLRREHEGWIATFNFRCPNTPSANAIVMGHN
jgi:hypothetical protein